MLAGKKTYLDSVLQQELSVVRESLIASCDPKNNIMQRLELNQKASSKLLAMEKQIEGIFKAENERKEAVMGFKGLVKETMGNLFFKDYLQSNNPTISNKRVGEHVTRILTERSASKKQTASIRK